MPTFGWAVLLLLLSARAGAQHASPWLPIGHWSTEAAVRLHALGLAPDLDPSVRQRTSARIAGLLRAARAAAATRNPGAVDGDERRVGSGKTLRLVAAYVERFSEEYPDAFGDSLIEAVPYFEGFIAPQLIVRENARLAGGFTLDREWAGPEPLPDLGTAGGLVHAGLASERIAVTLAVAGEGDVWRATQVTADIAAGPVAVWLGRRAPGFAPTSGGGLVLDGAVAFEGGGVYSLLPLRLPILGGVSGELFGGVLESNGFVSDPWLLGVRLHASPHARFDVGTTRVAVFGGMNGARFGVRQLFEVLVAANLGGNHADDQVASVDARWRPPLSVPIELYGEWGMHDIDPGVLLDMPSFALGVRVPMLPFASAFSAGIEHTQIARSCCENPPWYQHFELAEGWTEDGVPLGHPLGGHGREWRVHVVGAPFGACVLVDAAAFRRTRGDENLYAPERAGRALGIAATVDVRLRAWLSVGGNLRLEDGSGWRETRGGLHLRAGF